MVGKCHAGHTVGHRLVYDAGYRCLTVEQRVLAVDVEVYKSAHMMPVISEISLKPWRSK